MHIRRGRASARLGAGLLLAVACTAAPALAHAAPVAGEIAPLAACAPDAPPSASTDADTYEIGSAVTITGTCFTPRDNATISLITPNGPVQLAGQSTDSAGSVTWTYEPTAPGDFGADITVGQQQAYASFTVTESAGTGTGEAPPTEGEPTPEPDPTPEPEPEPSPEPEPTPEPTPDPEPEDPATVETPTPDELPADESTTEVPPPGTPSAPGEDVEREQEQEQDETTPPAPPSSPARRSTAPPQGQEPPPEQDDPAPTASGLPSASEETPGSPAPTAPGTARDDTAPAQSAYSVEQRETATLAVLITSLFAHGVSDGDVGISPARAAALADAEGLPVHGGGEDGGDASDGGGEDGGDASDGGGEELAETGAEVAVPAALAALLLGGGAGLLAYRHRQDR